MHGSTMSGDNKASGVTRVRQSNLVVLCPRTPCHRASREIYKAEVRCARRANHRCSWTKP